MSSLIVDSSTDWKKLSGGEIFDRLVKKGNKLGIQGNKLLKMLTRTKFITSDVGTVLGKNNRDRRSQREHFANISEEGLSLLQEHMVTFYASPPSLDVGDISKNLRARAWHLADDAQATGYLEVIFGGVGKAARRAEVDDKVTRTLGNWKHLCDNFFNSDSWTPQNCFDNTRVSEICPSRPPEVPFSPEELRSLFSKMRSQYSLFNDRYHRSGQLVDGEGDGDDDFFSNFAGSDAVYLYAHLLFKGQPPKFCTRDVNQPCDLGCPAGGSPAPSSSGSVGSGDQPGSGMKRKYSDLTKDDLMDVLKPSDDEILRDKSMASFFNVSNLDNILKSETFHALPQDVQEKLTKKYEELVTSTYLT
jgi:hypothetical protein